MIFTRTNVGYVDFIHVNFYVHTCHRIFTAAIYISLFCQFWPISIIFQGFMSISKIFHGINDLSKPHSYNHLKQFWFSIISNNDWALLCMWICVCWLLSVLFGMQFWCQIFSCLQLLDWKEAVIFYYLLEDQLGTTANVLMLSYSLCGIVQEMNCA